MITDPYKVLGLEQDASADDIKKAYRLMAKKYHPDLHPDDPDIQEKMNEINEAYDMLTNPNKYAAKRAQETAQQEDSDVEIVADHSSQAASKVITRPVVLEGDSPEIEQVVALLNSNKFHNAIHVLTQIPSSGRNARWYYLSALGNQMLGNGTQATELMQKACQLSPQDQTYMNLLLQFQEANRTYGKKSGFPITPLIPIAGIIGYLLGKFFLG